MSGTEREMDILQRLQDLTDRKTPIASLRCLANSIMTNKIERPDLNRVAIALDSSAFMRLNKLNKREDVIDFLSTQHAGPLIIPGQVIQEFWNNHLNVVDTQAAKLKKKHEELKSITREIDPSFEDFHQKIGRLIDDFQEEHGYIYDEGARRTTLQAIETLSAKAKVPYTPRLPFAELAKIRKATKTPPGFKDTGDGDFFVWLDLLFGLMQAIEDGAVFSHVILVTNDTKVDWSKNNATPHPILSAEIGAAVGSTFEVMKVEALERAVLDFLK